MPGIQYKNSNPPKLFSIANSDNNLSLTALPAIIISSDRRDILLKLFDSLITAPSKVLSEIKVFDPPPRIKNFSSFLIIFKNLIKSFKFFAL